jgi:hypothetical protein
MMRGLRQLLHLRSLLFSTGEVLGPGAVSGQALPSLSNTLQQTAGLKKQANEVCLTFLAAALLTALLTLALHLMRSYGQETSLSTMVDSCK